MRHKKLKLANEEQARQGRPSSQQVHERLFSGLIRVKLWAGSQLDPSCFFGFFGFLFQPPLLYQAGKQPQIAISSHLLRPHLPVSTSYAS